MNFGMEGHVSTQQEAVKRKFLMLCISMLRVAGRGTTTTSPRPPWSPPWPIHLIEHPVTTVSKCEGFTKPYACRQPQVCTCRGFTPLNRSGDNFYPLRAGATWLPTWLRFRGNNWNGALSVGVGQRDQIFALQISATIITHHHPLLWRLVGVPSATAPPHSSVLLLLASTRSRTQNQIHPKLKKKIPEHSSNRTEQSRCAHALLSVHAEREEGHTPVCISNSISKFQFKPVAREIESLHETESVSVVTRIQDEILCNVKRRNEQTRSVPF